MKERLIRLSGSTADTTCVYEFIQRIARAISTIENVPSNPSAASCICTETAQTRSIEKMKELNKESLRSEKKGTSTRFPVLKVVCVRLVLGVARYSRIGLVILFIAHPKQLT